MSSDSGGGATERQREREGRSLRKLTRGRSSVDAPRQRRPALAALALLLIVGGGAVAGLLAVRMDSREPVLVAREDIPAGTMITEEMLAEAQVATDSVPTIPVDLADQVVGAYSTAVIRTDTLLDEGLLSAEPPTAADRAVVGVTLNPRLTPGALAAGDLVQVVRASAQGEGGTSAESGTPLTTALVLSVGGGASDDLGGASARTASLLVPADAASAVIAASAADGAGLATLQTGQSTEVELEVLDGSSASTPTPEETPEGSEGSG